MSAQEPESSPYRILYVSAAGQVGGAEKSLLDLLDGLDRSRFEPAVAFPAGGDLAEELARREIPLSLVSLSRFRRTWNPFQLAGYAFRWCRGASDVRQVIDFRKPDVVHANGDMAQVYVGKAGRARPAARVWHVRDTASPVWLRRRLAARADRIIAVSHSVEKALVSQGIPAEKIRVVLNGIDTKPFESVPPPPEGPATVGMVAHFYPWKGHRDFLHVAAEVVREMPETRFAIAGEDLLGEQPGYREELMRLRSELGLGDAVSFLGRVHDVPGIMASWQLVAVMSRSEPFGRCVVESMAAGRPVIAWNEGGPAEILAGSGAGKLVDGRERIAFARALIDLLRDATARRDMAERGRSVARARFHCSRTAAEVQALYRELLQ